MSPLGHLALLVIAVHWRRYDGLAAWSCLVAGFAPDLVDKPLGLLGVTTSLHTVAHSVFVATLVVGWGMVTSRRATAERDRGTLSREAIAVGWASHLAADLPLAVPRYLTQYVWPLRIPAPPATDPVGAYVVSYAVSPAFATECALAVAAVVVIRTDPARLRSLRHVTAQSDHSTD